MEVDEPDVPMISNNMEKIEQDLMSRTSTKKLPNFGINKTISKNISESRNCGDSFETFLPHGIQNAGSSPPMLVPKW